MTALGTVVWF